MSAVPQKGLTVHQARRLIVLHDQIAQIYEDAGAAEAAAGYRKVARQLQAALPKPLRRWKRAA